MIGKITSRELNPWSCSRISLYLTFNTDIFILQKTT